MLTARCSHGPGLSQRASERRHAYDAIASRRDSRRVTARTTAQPLGRVAVSADRAALSKPASGGRVPGRSRGPAGRQRPRLAAGESGCGDASLRLPRRAALLLRPGCAGRRRPRPRPGGAGARAAGPGVDVVAGPQVHEAGRDAQRDLGQGRSVHDGGGRWARSADGAAAPARLVRLDGVPLRHRRVGGARDPEPRPRPRAARSRRPQPALRCLSA